MDPGCNLILAWISAGLLSTIARRCARAFKIERYIYVSDVLLLIRALRKQCPDFGFISGVVG